MKEFIKRLIAIVYLILSVSILIIAIVYPFALAFKDAPPIWTCFILYPITLIIMASQSQVINYINKNNIL